MKLGTSIYLPKLVELNSTRSYNNTSACKRNAIDAFSSSSFAVGFTSQSIIKSHLSCKPGSSELVYVLVPMQVDISSLHVLPKTKVR